MAVPGRSERDDWSLVEVTESDPELILRMGIFFKQVHTEASGSFWTLWKPMESKYLVYLFCCCAQAGCFYKMSTSSSQLATWPSMLTFMLCPFFFFACMQTIRASQRLEFKTLKSQRLQFGRGKKNCFRFVAGHLIFPYYMSGLCVCLVCTSVARRQGFQSPFCRPKHYQKDRPRFTI